MIELLLAIMPVTVDQEARFNELNHPSQIIFTNSNERVGLLFLIQANMFKRLATDDIISISDAEYMRLAIANYNAYLKYSK